MTYLQLAIRQLFSYCQVEKKDARIKSRMKKRILFFLFFLSGFSALIYEVIWQRQLGLIFGNTVYSVTAILSIFFTGLALGSFIFGRIADWLIEKHQNHRYLITVFSFIEIFIGIYAFLTPLIFKSVERLQIIFFSNLKENFSFNILTLIFSFFSLIIPTTLIGGTFPVIYRFLETEKERGKVISNLYSLNTLGGVLGVFIAGFFLIKNFGVKETLYLAALLNILIGLICLFSIKKITGQTKIIKEKINFPRKEELNIATFNNRKENILLLVFSGLIGLSALALEVLWVRLLILIFGPSTYSFSLILVIFLLGIAFGSFLANKFFILRRNLANWISYLTISLGLIIFFTTPFLGNLPLLFLNLTKGDISLFTNLRISFLISFLIMLLPTTLMGIIFPLVIKNFNDLNKKQGQALGLVYGINTLGGIFGSILSGFILIPQLGLQKGIYLVTIVYFFAGVLILMKAKTNSLIKIILIIFVVILSITSWFFPSWNKHILNSGLFIYGPDYSRIENKKAAIEKGEILFYQEGLSGTILVKKKLDDIYLRIDGKTDASSTQDLSNMLLTGHLPMLFSRNPEDVLVIGLGSGITLGAVTRYPVKQIDLVEIEPAIIKAALYFNEYNNKPLDDKRLKIYIADGRNFLLVNKKKYDVISSQPSNPWVKGNSNLFTKEYFQLAKSRLKDEGIFLQWVQMYYLDKESLKSILKTFREVFPEMTVWTPVFNNDLLLIGKKEPLKIDHPLLEKKLNLKTIQKDLARIQIKEPAQILGLFISDKKKINQLVEKAKIHSDNNPILEFKAPFSIGKETVGENLKMLLAIQEKPDDLLNNQDSVDKKKIETNLKIKELVFKGKIALTERNLDRVIFFLQKAMNLDSDSVFLKKELAQVYFYQAEQAFNEKDFNNAKKKLLKVTELDPLQSNSYLNLGAIYYQEGDLVNAAINWQKAKELDPQSQEIKKNLELLNKKIEEQIR